MKQQISNLEIDQQLKWNNNSEMEQQLNGTAIQKWNNNWNKQ